MKSRLALTIGLLILAYALTITGIALDYNVYMSFGFAVIAIITYASTNTVSDRRYEHSKKLKNKAIIDFGVKIAYVLFVCIAFFFRLEILIINYILVSIAFLAEIITSTLVCIEYKNCTLADDFKIKKTMQSLAGYRLICAYTLYTVTIVLITLIGKEWAIIYTALPVYIIALMFEIFGYKIIDLREYGIKVKRILFDKLLILCGMVLVFIFSDSVLFNIDAQTTSIPIIAIFFALLSYIPSIKTNSKILYKLDITNKGEEDSK